MTDNVRLGEKVKGYVRKVEGKDIVVSMQREGMELLDDAKVKIMNYLEANGGYVRLNDDTDPDEIKLRLHMSKKTFKKAAGMLFKEGKILLTKMGIKFNKTGEIPTEWENTKLLSEDAEGPSSVAPPKARKKPEPAAEEPWVDKPFVPKTKTPAARSEKPKERDAERPRPTSDDKPRSDRPKKTLTFKGK
jgi:hypothetical protein